MAQISFGVGSLIATPPAGSADMTPVQIALLSEVTIDLTMTTKELKGDQLFAVDEQISGGKITGKAKTAEIHAALLAAVLGATASQSTGSQGAVRVNTGAIAAGSYDTTAAANFVSDLGVRDASGVPLKNVGASGTVAPGAYKVSALGVYTFDASANGSSFTILYAKKATTGTTITATNARIGGSGYRYTLELYNTTNGESFGVKLYSVLIPKLALNFKNEDYTEQDLDFSASAQAGTGNLITFWTVEQ